MSLDLTPAIEAIFESTNQFLPTFAQVAGIGVGISLAIALVTWLGTVLISAFRGRGR